MTRYNALSNFAVTRDSVAWGKDSINHNLSKNTATLVFAAVLIVCSVTVGCSSDQPKPERSANQIPVTPSQNFAMPTLPAPVMQTENKPAPKKVFHKKPATVNYTNKTYGVTFEYPRRYAIETGDAATELLMSSPIPMNFVQPGGVALAAVELPETSFANTDFSSAFFNISVNQALTADQCVQFSVPQPKVVAPVASSTEAGSNQTAPTPATPTPSPETQSASVQSAPAPASTPEPAPGSKLRLGDHELRGTETVSGEGTRQSDSKYFHLFQNGACYEFALNVTTVASEDGIVKHVDRDKVFGRLEKILATVKINPVAAPAPEVTAETPATPAAPETPAQ